MQRYQYLIDIADARRNPFSGAFVKEWKERQLYARNNSDLLTMMDQCLLDMLKELDFEPKELLAILDPGTVDIRIIIKAAIANLFGNDKGAILGSTFRGLIDSSLGECDGLSLYQYVLD